MPRKRPYPREGVDLIGWLILAAWLGLAIILLQGCALQDFNAQPKGLGEKVRPDLLFRIVGEPYICAPKGEDFAQVTVIIVPRGMEPTELYINDNGQSVVLPPDTGYTGHIGAGLGKHVLTIQMGTISKSRTYYVVRCK